VRRHAPRGTDTTKFNAAFSGIKRDECGKRDKCKSEVGAAAVHDAILTHPLRDVCRTIVRGGIPG